MGFFGELQELFGTKSLYGILSIDKDATDKQLKKAYHRLSLKYHPDRSSEDDKEINTKKFQALCKIHSVLSNTEQRNVYDETGELLDESDICAQQRDWETYWRILFKKVSKKDIETFAKEFRDTKEEAAEVKKYYLQYEGDIEEILNNVLCCTEDDEDRFGMIIQKAIDAGELPEFEKFTNIDHAKRDKRKEKAAKEEVEAKEHAKNLGLDADGDLKQLILKRNTDREKEMSSFFDDLEAKYCQKKKPKVNGKKSTSTKGTKRKRK